jgi:cytochrome c553
MKFRPTLSALGLGLIAIVAGQSVALSARAEGSAERGKTLAYTCHGCHGIPNYKNAYPSYSVPKLGGQHAKYLASALGEYASGDRAHPTMHSHATTLSEQERADIAAYLQSEPVKAAEVVGTPPPAIQTCVACHGADGAKTQTDDFPVLAGQQADYLVEALQDYKSGKRKNPVMGGIISGVDPKDFPAIAQFFSQQRGLCSTDEIRTQGKCKQ